MGVDLDDWQHLIHSLSGEKTDTIFVPVLISQAVLSHVLLCCHSNRAHTHTHSLSSVHSISRYVALTFAVVAYYTILGSQVGRSFDIALACLRCCNDGFLLSSIVSHSSRVMVSILDDAWRSCLTRCSSPDTNMYVI